MTLTEHPARFDHRPVLICFSHLRWNFVFQRPQHIMQRLARTHRVVFWEEPLYTAGAEPHLECYRDASGVEVAVPHLGSDLDSGNDARIRDLLTEFLGDADVAVRWYYTPMMLGISRDLKAGCTVYDCMDELANFRFAPADLLALENELLAAADIVFTGGYSLYEAKRHRHHNVLPFPSSVDVDHFAQARSLGDKTGGAPRLGYYGVIDERIDLDLVAHIADARPEWSIEMVGPIAKIAPEDLPRRVNIHYLGARSYDELPSALSGWDVALMPFAINAATRFISPTKTPEYLAAGKPVVSTPITDVIRHYGEIERVSIAGEPDAFVSACDTALATRQVAGLAEADALLSTMSWDKTVARMQAAIAAVPGKALRHYDYLIVGAGFAGAVLAERLASDAGRRVLVVDRRTHIGGNAYDRHDDAGILIHQYGPHIFHTNSADIFDYLSRFTEWREYEHRVLASVDGRLVPVPINRTTLNTLYDLNLETDDDAARYLAARAEPVDAVRTSEDVVVNAVGRELYEKFFRGYTRKQWGLDPSELDKSVTARVPTRTNVDDRYFTDTFQAMPADGYTAVFKRMLDHPNIDIRLGVDFGAAKAVVDYDHLIFTGPIDEYFGHRYGKLPYRSLRFRHETIEQEWFQAVGTVNYPAEEMPYTRVSEYKHLTGQRAPVTSITYEYPSAEGDPYYPIPRPENQDLFKRYEALALQEPGVTFVGRLATYRYYNMDQVVGQALAAYRRLREKEAAPELVAAE